MTAAARAAAAAGGRRLPRGGVAALVRGGGARGERLALQPDQLRSLRSRAGFPSGCAGRAWRLTLALPRLIPGVATQTVEPAIAAPRRGRRGSVNPVRAWVREQLTTTPGRLALVSIAVVIGAVCFGAMALIAGQARSRAANSAKTDTEPLLAEAANLYASLSDANATATTTFLVGGLEPPARRARYLADVASASNSLASLTRQVGTAAGARDSVATIAAQLPIYAGLIEAARANNRQGLPVGAAYLRQASNLLDTTILPAAGRLYTIEAQRLRDDYDTGTSLTWLLVFIIAMLAAAGAAGADAALPRRDQPSDPQHPDRDRDAAAGGADRVGSERHDQRAERAREGAARRLGLGRGPVGCADPRLPRSE